jgi:hypothetical protein
VQFFINKSIEYKSQVPHPFRRDNKLSSEIETKTLQNYELHQRTDWVHGIKITVQDECSEKKFNTRSLERRSCGAQRSPVDMLQSRYKEDRSTPSTRIKKNGSVIYTSVSKVQYAEITLPGKGKVCPPIQPQKIIDFGIQVGIPRYTRKKIHSLKGN